MTCCDATRTCEICLYDEILLSYSVVYCVSALSDPYAGPYACVRTASQPIRSKNSFCILISIQEFVLLEQHGLGFTDEEAKPMNV